MRKVNAHANANAVPQILIYVNTLHFDNFVGIRIADTVPNRSENTRNF